MLVLSRRVDEKIVIGEEGEISIMVCDIRDDVVRIGIKAPKQVPIYRQEVYEDMIFNTTQRPDGDEESLSVPQDS